MSAIDSWRKVKRVVAATSAFGETPRVDENATFRTGGIQGRPQGSQSEPDPMPARTAAPYAQGSQNSQYQYTGQPSQNQDQGQPWPYTSPQPTGGPFNQVQRTHSSPAAANGFAQQSSPVQSFDPYYRGQAPSAPPQSFDTASSVPFNTPQRTYPPASNHFPQSQNIFPTDPPYARQGIQSPTQQDYHQQGSYPSQDHHDHQYQAQYVQRMGSWGQSAEPSTYQSNITSICTYCGTYLSQ
jgi:hypothetical protein